MTKGRLIDLMMIDQELHRRRIGTRLLRHVEEVLFEHHDRLKLESFAPNEKANRFYRKNGWTEVRRSPDAAAGVDKIEFYKAASDL